MVSWTFAYRVFSVLFPVFWIHSPIRSHSIYTVKSDKVTLLKENLSVYLLHVSPSW